MPLLCRIGIDDTRRQRLLFNGDYDECKNVEQGQRARKTIRKTVRPTSDPILGANGPACETVEEEVGVRGGVMTVRIEKELSAAEEKHFRRRAHEARDLATTPAFKSLRDQFLELARRYEALAAHPPQSWQMAYSRRALP
jgi:hypothetical protein